MIGEASDQDIKKIFANVIVMVGIKQLPDEVATIKLLNHLRRRHRGLTLAEIELAYDLAIAREFECEIRPFGFLSCEYVGGVLAAYKAYKKRKISGDVLSKAYPQPEVLVLEQKKSKSYQEELDKQAVEYAHYRYLKGETNLYMPLWNLYLHHSKTIGVCNSKGEFPKKKIKRAAVKQFILQHYKTRCNPFKSKQEFEQMLQENKQVIRVMAGELSVIWLFEKWKSEGWKLNDQETNG